MVQVFELVKEVSSQLRAPLVMFQYFNPMLRCTVDTYCQRASAAGAAGKPVLHADNGQAVCWDDSTLP